jgi:DNA-directed RNA polymerases I, II, and III subunit RPABC3
MSVFSADFDVRALNENGKKFERVNRLHCRTDDGMEMVVDVNSELFHVKAHDKLRVMLASTLNPNGGEDDGLYKPPSKEGDLSDGYDYVMHGTVFLIKHIENQYLEVQISFGGLLFRLRGEQQLLDQLEMDKNVYLLMRKQTDMMDFST